MQPYSITPFDPGKYIGTVTVVTPNSIRANFPRAVSSPEDRQAIKGNVGDFVFIECDEYAVFGRITEVSLPDRERLSIEPQMGKEVHAHPIGHVQLLASMDIVSQKTIRGVPSYPKIGDRIFVAHPGLVTKMARASERTFPLMTDLGTVSVSEGAEVSVPPESLFGRHCGVLGATGGGKSWTLARLIESIKSIHGKAILFDATGEFASLSFIDQHVAMGVASHPFEKAVSFPYKYFTEADLFAFFSPSGQSQGPKLREAIKSLKLVQALKGTTPPTGVEISNDRIILKAKKQRKPFFTVAKAHEARINSEVCDFDIKDLSDQIGCECIYPSDRSPDIWGDYNQSELGYCASLRMRIEQRVSAPELSCIFQDDLPTLTEEISNFINNKDACILRLSMSNLSFQYNARELIVNAIGRYLLKEARNGRFKKMPTVCLLDEAHQFLEKTVGDEFSAISLDAFGLIAKEGRKYGLTTVLATQRPRDIPEDVLSQLGTLIVHRLTNDRDRGVVERACGEIDRSAAAFLPMLGQGEALIVGTDFPMPVPLKIKTPSKKPNSLGPEYQKYWGKSISAPSVAEAPPVDQGNTVTTTKKTG